MPPPPEVEKGFSSRQLAIAGGVLLLVIIIIAVIYAALNYSSLFSLPTQSSVGGPATGRLELTLQSIADPTDGATYSYSLTDGTKMRYRVSGDFDPYAVNYSPDGTKLAYALFDGATNESSIYIGTATPNAQTGELDIGNAQKISQTSLPESRDPVWSSDGTKIAYEAKYTTMDWEIPESWTIYVNDLQGNEQTVGNGYAPVFSPDGATLLFLKNDGVYLYHLTGDNAHQTEKVNLLSTAEGKVVSAHGKLALSHDGQWLIWTDHIIGRLLVFRVSSWNPFAVAFEKGIDASAIWSQFSPDDHYLAVEVAPHANAGPDTASSPGTAPSPDLRVEVYSFPDLKEIRSIDFSQYDDDFFWMTDWLQGNSS